MGSPTKLLNTKEMLTYLVSIVLMLAAPKAEAAECGLSGYHGSQHHRIVGGENAFRNEYPWQVLLLGEGMCGGTIISKNKILTAQHCTRGNRPSTFEVYVGVQNLEEVGNNFKRVCGLAEPDEYQYHPYHHDIAILTLCEELEFSESVRPICLPDPNDEKFTDDKAVATGRRTSKLEIFHKPYRRSILKSTITRNAIRVIEELAIGISVLLPKVRTPVRETVEALWLSNRMADILW